MQKLRVGVLRGGPSSDYDLSLKTGGHVLQHIPEDKYVAHDIYISRDGVWHMRGFEVSPERALKQVDVVFNALHGEYGEDGTLQRLLDTFNTPYTGSGALASALGMNKRRAKEVLAQLDVRTPLSRTISREEVENFEALALDLFRTFPQPIIIKPIRSGSSRGIVFVDSFPRLKEALAQALTEMSEVLVEEYISGKEVTSGVVKEFRGEDRYTLLPIEIALPKSRRFFDSDLKLEGSKYALCPSNLTSEEKLKIREMTRNVHEALGLGHYSRIDFILTPKQVYFLEANTQPDLTEGSLVARALDEAGCAFPEFLDHIITLAAERK